MDGSEYDGQDRGLGGGVHLKNAPSAARGDDDVHQGQMPGKRIEPKRPLLDTLDKFRLDIPIWQDLIILLLISFPLFEGIELTRGEILDPGRKGKA